MIDVGQAIAEATILLRLAAAMLLAGIVGWERESAGKSAGLRTHIFVGMGAMLFVVLGDTVVARYVGASDLVRTDPMRVVEAIMTAVGFLGAGTIFVSRADQRVRGLTTAASIWVTAAIGIAIGLERYVLAVGATALTLVVLRTLAHVIGYERDDA